MFVFYIKSEPQMPQEKLVFDIWQCEVSALLAHCATLLHQMSIRQQNPECDIDQSLDAKVYDEFAKLFEELKENTWRDGEIQEYENILTSAFLLFSQHVAEDLRMHYDLSWSKLTECVVSLSNLLDKVKPHRL